MHYILSIQIDDFYWPIHADFPYAVIVKDGAVLDSAPQARSAGVVPGMVVGEAKAILGANGSFIQWDPLHYQQRQSQWLNMCLDWSDIIEPLSHHEALLDLSAHPEPAALQAEIELQLAAHGWNARVGGGGCRWMARLAAEYGDPNGSAWLTPRRYVGQFSISQLDIFPADVKRRLKLLGYIKVHELNAIPMETLRAQFGEAAFDLKVMALGSGPVHVNACYPPDSVTSRFRPETAIDNTLGLDKALHVLSKRLGANLKRRDLCGKKLELTVETENHIRHSYKRVFSKVIHDASTALSALSLTLKPTPEEDILSLEATLPELAPLQVAQTSFIGQPHRDPKAEAEHILEGFQAAMGKKALWLASQETPRQHFLRAYKDAVGWR